MGLNKNGLHIGAVAYKKFSDNTYSGNKLMLLLDRLEQLPDTSVFEELVRQMLEMGRHIMEAEAANLLLLKGKGDSSIGTLYTSLPSGMSDQEVLIHSLNKNTNYGGWVIEHQIPLIDNEVEQDRAYLFSKLEVPLQIKNLICAPLIKHSDDDELIGIIQFINRHRSEGFGEEDLSVCQVLANHIAKELGRNRADRRRKEHLAQKDLFLSELHHRVKNNLSFISGIIELEESRIKDLTTRDVLKKVKVRLNSVNVVYDLLSGQGTFSHIELGPYIKTITENISKTLSSPVRDIEIEVDVDPITAEPEQALSCGLIINELVVNGFKHAFTYRKEGRMQINLSSNDDHVLLIYKDNGLGISPDVDIDKSDSLGLKIIKSFTHQLRGSYAFDQPGEHEGTQFTLIFPLKVSAAGS